jgi:hypothetical protein
MDGTAILMEVIFEAVKKLWKLVQDIKSGAINPDNIDLKALKARVDAIGDLPIKRKMNDA